MRMAKELQLRRSRAACTKSLYQFYCEAWAQMDPAPFSGNWHLEETAEHLQAVSLGLVPRLLINFPPRCSKSLLISVAWPAWVWAQERNPDVPLMGPHVQFLFASYAQTLSERDSLKMKRLIASDWYQERWGKRFSIRQDKDTVRKFENTAGGYRLATSVGGSLTGEGGDCFAAGTLVETPSGPIAIERVKPGMFVYSMDLRRERVKISRVVATRVKTSNDLYKIVSTDGNRVRCTGDHRIYSPGRGFVRANRLGVSARLAVFAGAAGEPRKDDAPPSLRRVREGNREAAVRSAQGPAAQSDGALLQEVLPKRSFWSEVCETVRHMREARAIPWHTILLSHMRKGWAHQSSQNEAMSGMRRIILWLDYVLLAYLREHRSLQTDARGRQFAVHGAGGSVFQPVPRTRAVDQTAGSLSMCDLQAPRFDDEGQQASFSPSHSPHGREYAQQCAGEFGDALRGLSQEAPSWHAGAVRRVERDSHGSEPVYDIQVEGNHNFFANGILSHNCIVVDDPINAKESNYETIRNAANVWWSEAMSTRLNAPRFGAKVVIMQRLHEDDLSGYILGKSGEDWMHLMLPMEFDSAIDNRTWLDGEVFFEDPRTEEGELLWPERFPGDVLERLKAELGPFAASGQLQQSPVPKGGGIIDRMWWQVWPAPGYEPQPGSPLTFPACSLIVGSVDTAYSERDENAWNAMTAWGVWNDQRDRPKVIMMEAWRARLPLRGVIPPECKTDMERKPHWGLAEKITDTVRRRQMDVLLIENKTRGADLAAEIRRLLRDGECQIIMIEPRGDKVARLHACQPMFADGMVFAPEKAWAETVITEVSQFPKSKWADYTDTCSQALSWLRNNGALLLGTEADVDNARRGVFQGQKVSPYDV